MLRVRLLVVSPSQVRAPERFLGVHRLVRRNPVAAFTRRRKENQHIEGWLRLIAWQLETRTLGNPPTRDPSTDSPSNQSSSSSDTPVTRIL